MKLLLTVLCALVTPSVGWAQQPFSTDDADTTPKGGVHVEAFDEYDWLQRSQTPHLQQNTVNMRVNYGVGHGLELDLDSPLITIVNDAATIPPRPFGIGDTNFGLKYNFRTEHEGSHVPAFAVAAYIEMPTGDAQTGLGSGLTDVWVYGIVQKTIAHNLVLRVNGGYVFTGNTSTGVVGITGARRHIITTGMSLARTMSQRMKIGAEIASAVAEQAIADRQQLQILVGGNYAIRSTLTLDVGLIAGHFAASPRVGLQLGFSHDFAK